MGRKLAEKSYPRVGSGNVEVSQCLGRGLCGAQVAEFDRTKNLCTCCEGLPAKLAEVCAWIWGHDEVATFGT
jgi:hypothetical protein